MEHRDHPTHRRVTQMGIGLLGSVVVLAYVAMLLGYLNTTGLFIMFVSCALQLLPWILWRNVRCQCPQCGVWLRVHPEDRGPPGGPKRYRCEACQIIWNDRMERGA